MTDEDRKRLSELIQATKEDLWQRRLDVNEEGPIGKRSDWSKLDLIWYVFDHWHEEEK